MSVFIHADMNAKVARVMERDGLSEDKARERIMKTDKKRASFYNFYSLDKRWGEVDSHDITLNSSKLGIEGSIDILYDYLKLRGFV